jgi:hypothetical protein
LESNQHFWHSSNQIGIKSNQSYLAFFELDWNQIKSSLLLAFFDGNQISTFDMKQATFLVSIKLLFVGSKDYVIGIQFPIGISSYSHFIFKLFEP